jgi:heme/copper-type cytochrome/quinol oxidase subunit 3
MTELASPSTDYSVLEREPPQIMGRNLTIGSPLWSSATVFFFLPFLFAYFYLRSLNQDHLWRPKHVDPSLTLGTLTAAAVVAAAVLLQLGLADHRRERRPAWRVKGAIALALLLVSIGLQIAEWSTQGFGPTDGGYASVYVGWTGLQVLFVFGLAYWVETTLATSLRYRKTLTGSPAPGEASGDPHRTAHDIDNPLSLVRPEIAAVSFFATTIAVIVFVTWVVLYLL